MAKRIRSKATAQTFHDDTQRLVALLLNSGLSVKDIGWYRSALAWCDRVAQRYTTEGHPITTSMVAGIVAAVSPQKHWNLNSKLAEDTITALSNGGTAGAWQYGKVMAIWNGGDPLAYLGQEKTLSFYVNIMSAGTDNVKVTIDRWALRAVTGDHSSGNTEVAKGDYPYWERCFLAAAAILTSIYGITLTGAQLQELLWGSLRGSYYTDDFAV